MTFSLSGSVAATIRKLRQARVAADYMPGATLTARDARDAMRDAAVIMAVMEEIQ